MVFNMSILNIYMKRLLKKLSHLSSLISHFSISKGFTLIELLVVIAVLGVLAAIVLLAVNPAEQLARARDTTRISAVTQLGRALQAYYTVQSPSAYPASPPAVSGDWMAPMVTSSDLKVRIGNASYATTPSVACTATGNQTVSVTNGTTGYGYCYLATAADAITYVQLESTLNKTKAGSCATTAWAIFATALGKAGLFCSATEPTVAGVTSLY